jgi:DNA adenine methylase
MTSPLRYPGGKTRACKKLDAIMQNHFDVGSMTSFASPFFGGGSFELFVVSKYNLHAIVNDKFTPLYTFWSQVKDNRSDLVQSISQNRHVTKEKFREFREKIMGCDVPLEQAMMYFVINRCSFSGATLSGGFSEASSVGRFTDSSVDRVERLDLRSFEFRNQDFKEFLRGVNPGATDLVFLDPPYYLEKGNKLYGKNGDMHEDFDHEGLRAALRGVPTWMMTYNDCDYIRQLYSDCTIVDIDWAYGMNATKKSSEIVIVHK